MATKKKLLQAAAGSAGGAGGLDIPDVFSTYLYPGNSSAQTITNGIDLDGEGGLWWLRRRTGTGSHALYDSTRATGSEHFPLFSNSTNAEYDDFDTTPTSTGFTINSTSSGTVNETGQDYVSWTWRKAPKFFDVIQYVGDGVLGRTVSHSLDSEVGMILVKQTNASGEPWYVYHRSLGTNKRIYLNTTGAAVTSSDGFWTVAPTSTEFSVAYNGTNKENATYIAYVFAHNDGDGEFGPDGDQDIIKCGSYTGNGSNTGPIIDLGFEPQWLMIKNAELSKEWRIHDVMRGMPVGGSGAFLQANSTAAETTDSGPVAILPNGFQLSQGGSETNENGDTHIYMAIRRGPLAVPEDATDVFDIYQNESSATVPAFKHPFPVDFAFYKAASNTEDWWYSARLLQDQNYRLNVQAYSGGSVSYAFDYMDGWFTSNTTQTDYYSWAWKRAPNFFDVVTYSGTNSVQNVPHNLGVAPKLMIIRMLKQNSPPVVYWEPAGNTENYFLTATANTDNSQYWNSTTPTDSVFTVKGPLGDVNYSGYNYHAMLFGELDGISKIGSYVGNGSTQNIDCGFTSGARLILIKGSTSGDWILFDAERGVVAGDDPYLRLNSGSAQITNKDYIDAYSSGFTVKTDVSTIVNANGTTYYFYAIA